MTKSEYPQGGGAPFEQTQPQQPANPVQQPMPAQPMPLPVDAYVPPVAPVPVQPALAQPIPPQPTMAQAVPPQPQTMAPATYEVAPATHVVQGVPGQPVYAEQVPVPEQMVAPVPEQYLPPVGAPIDDYHYPEGQQMPQSILPEVPAVAVPPRMDVPGQPVMPVHQAPVHDGAYVEPAVPGGAGEQISQRLAQLQNQYDDELSGNVQSAVDTTPQFAQQIAEPAPVFQAPVEPISAFEPPMAPEPPQHQFAQPDVPSTHQYAPETPVSHEYDPASMAVPPMAATAMTGEAEHSHYAHENHMHAHDDGLSSEIAQELPAAKSGFKKLALGGAFVAALAVGGGAAYTGKLSQMFGEAPATGAAPTIKAATSPIKIIKQKQARAGASINKAVHNRLDGGDSRSISASGLSENIVRKTTSGAGTITAASSGMMPNGDTKTRSISIGSNAPRRVKTLIVRPDGTILRPVGSDATKPMVKKVASSGIVAATLEKSASKPGNRIRRMKTIAETNNARRLGQAAPRAKIVSLQPPAMRKIKEKASARIATRQARSPIAGDIGEPFVVQVTSRTSQTGALAAFADMQQKYPSLIGEFAPDIQRADLGSKGVWYRLRVGPVNGKTAAADLCSNLKEAGHPGCFVRRK